MTMIVIVLDEDREDLECFEKGNVDLFEDTLSILSDCDIVSVYFINTNDKTWNKLADYNSKRLDLSEKEVKRYLRKAIYVFVYKNGKIKKCLPF
jgi:hypothetical protein